MHTLHLNQIEDFAYTYLKTYYKQHYSTEDVFVFIDEKAKSGATADGLFTFITSEKDPLFIAALSTDFSYKISSLLAAYKKKKFKTFIFTLSLFSTVLAASGSYWVSKNLAAPALSVTLLPVIYLCLIAIHWSFQKRQLVSMVNTLKRLPANQKWIGISISSQVFKGNKLADNFLAICREKGIGIITVGKRSKVVLMLEPKIYSRRSGDFLSFYKSEFSIRKEVLGDKIMRVA